MELAAMQISLVSETKLSGEQLIADRVYQYLIRCGLCQEQARGEGQRVLHELGAENNKLESVQLFKAAIGMVVDDIVSGRIRVAGVVRSAPPEDRREMRAAESPRRVALLRIDAWANATRRVIASATMMFAARLER